MPRQIESEAEVKAIVGQIAPPAGVGPGVSVVFGEDASGRPAIFLRYPLHASMSTKDDASRLNSFARAVAEAVIDADAERWAYVRFDAPDVERIDETEH